MIVLKNFFVKEETSILGIILLKRIRGCITYKDEFLEEKILGKIKENRLIIFPNDCQTIGYPFNCIRIPILVYRNNGWKFFFASVDSHFSKLTRVPVTI